jgi:thiol:disulfide interchange protein DsbC
MIKKLYWFALTAAALLSVSACVDAQEAKIKKALQNKLGTDAPIESVVKTPYAGLYEVKVDGEIIYSDAEGRHIFIGRVIDMETSRDLTKARLDDISRVKFADLPLDLAVKSVKGDGRRVIAVFEDPNCGYCKRLRKTLADMKDITIYSFIYPVLGEDSNKKSRNLWCAADRAKALDDWMLEGKAPPQAPESCSSAAIVKVMELGKKYNVTGTPTIVFADGSRAPGAVDAKTLESKLSSVK